MLYRLYGLTIDSPWQLPCPAGSGPADVRFVHSRRRPSPAPRDWFERTVLTDGSEHLIWADHFEFRISPDGGIVSYLPLAEATHAMVETLLLGQVLSFALLKLGREPIHATVLERHGQAIALTGFSGQGKSTLAAALLTRGWRMMTDDLMVLKGLDVLPGMPRIKLYPRSARILKMRGIPMDKGATKELILLPASMFCGEVTPLARVYALRNTDAGRVTVRRLSAKAAFIVLTSNTFNRRVTEGERLRQQFTEATNLALVVPVKSVSFRRTIRGLGATCDAIDQDLSRP